MKSDTGPDANDGNRTHYRSHSLTRGLEVISAVAASDAPLTLTALHTITGFPKSTLVRLLSVLEEQSYLVKVDERPAYRLGHSLLPIVVGYFEAFSGTDLLRPHLSELARSTGWTANLGTLDGSRVLHLCVEFPDRSIYYTTAEGSFAGVHCTGLGKAMLSVLGEGDQLRSLPKEPFEALTANTVTTVEEMLRELQAIRVRGYAIDDEEADLGLRCLSLPIVLDGALLGAISIAGPAGEASAEQEALAVKALHRARDQILAMPELPSILAVAGPSTR